MIISKFVSRRVSIVVASLVAITLILSTGLNTFAASTYIRIPYDDDGDVFYRGEVIDLYFEMDDVWDSYYTQVFAILLDSNNEAVDSQSFGFIPANGSINKFTSFKTDNLSDGEYTVGIIGTAVDSDGTAATEISSDEWEQDSRTFYVKSLLPPKSVKAKAGKKKVTVTYKAASGASKYVIYRSTKKSGKYKKIATTKKTKYVDKKVKKGKKYYYKVKTVRSVTNTVTSSYSKVASSKKVKK